MVNYLPTHLGKVKGRSGTVTTCNLLTHGAKGVSGARDGRLSLGMAESSAQLTAKMQTLSLSVLDSR